MLVRVIHNAPLLSRVRLRGTEAKAIGPIRLALLLQLFAAPTAAV